MKFDFHDILIEPAKTTTIASRKEVNHLYDNKSLPLFVAPMDTVVGPDNYSTFVDLGFNVCLPRNMSFNNIKEAEKIGECFHSYGLDEFITRLDKAIDGNILLPNKILIDVANGHMSKLLIAVREFKLKYPKHVIMVGNIANPETYKLLADVGADYIRVGIGNGGGCLTTQQTGIGYPMASLIHECRKIKSRYNLQCAIVADGGFKEYSDIIKALALGADYVMLGSILNKAIESSGDTYWKFIKLPSKNIASYLYKKGLNLKKKFRGMSTKEVQKSWGNTVLKTSEGVVRYYNVEYTLSGWLRNFVDYLKSSMSYTNSRTLREFIGEVQWNLITNSSYKRFNK